MSELKSEIGKSEMIRSVAASDLETDDKMANKLSNNVSKAIGIIKGKEVEQVIVIGDGDLDVMARKIASAQQEFPDARILVGGFKEKSWHVTISDEAQKKAPEIEKKLKDGKFPTVIDYANSLKEGNKISIVNTATFDHTFPLLIDENGKEASVNRISGRLHISGSYNLRNIEDGLDRRIFQSHFKGLLKNIGVYDQVEEFMHEHNLNGLSDCEIQAKIEREKGSNFVEGLKELLDGKKGDKQQESKSDQQPRTIRQKVKDKVIDLLAKFKVIVTENFPTFQKNGFPKKFQEKYEGKGDDLKLSSDFYSVYCKENPDHALFAKEWSKCVLLQDVEWYFSNGKGKGNDKTECETTLDKYLGDGHLKLSPEEVGKNVTDLINRGVNGEIETVEQSRKELMQAIGVPANMHAKFESDVLWSGKDIECKRMSGKFTKFTILAEMNQTLIGDVAASIFDGAERLGINTDDLYNAEPKKVYIDYFLSELDSGLYSVVAGTAKPSALDEMRLPKELKEQIKAFASNEDNFTSAAKDRAKAIRGKNAKAFLLDSEKGGFVKEDRRQELIDLCSKALKESAIPEMHYTTNVDFAAMIHLGALFAGCEIKKNKEFLTSKRGDKPALMSPERFNEIRGAILQVVQGSKIEIEDVEMSVPNTEVSSLRVEGEPVKKNAAFRAFPSK